MIEKKENILISVLLPVFRPDLNQLEEAIDSILEQTYRNLEIILLYEPADSEKESVVDYINGFSDKRIRLITLPSKTGLPRSLNKGIEESNGKYIARMDADDISRPDRIMHQYEYMESHPNIDILGGCIRHMSSGVLAFNRFITPEQRSIRLLFGNAGIAHPTAFFRKSSFERCGLRYDESIRGSEDYRLWADAVIKGLSIDCLPEIVLDYRDHENQASKVLSEEMVSWNVDTRKKLLHRYFDASTAEEDVFVSFGEDERMKYTFREYEAVLDKILKDNRELNVHDPKLLSKELVWQWFLFCQHQVRRYGNWGLVRSRYLWKIMIPTYFVYLLQQIVILAGK